MSWVDDNKGEGPWPFTEQLDKWGYLNNPRWTDAPGPPVNYTGREDEEPQVWDIGDQNNHIVVANKFSKDHKPCGHWHKKPIEVPEPEIPEFEIYFELLPGSAAQPYTHPYSDLLCSESFIPINVDNFDGDLTWQFEVIGFNSNSFDVTLQAVDSNGNVCSSVILPSGTVGPTGYELYRFRSDFISFIYNDTVQYGIKIVVPEGEFLTITPLKCMISVARIIVRQSNATKTSMQIPLYGSYYNYPLQEYNSYPYDSPLGYGLSDSHYVDIESGSNYKNVSLWKYNSAELSNISKVIFSPAAKGAINKITGTWQVIASTLDFVHFHQMLYSTTAHDTLRANATPGGWVDETQVHTDNVSGLVYTPIPGSYIYWDGSPYPFTYNLTPNFSGLAPGTHYIAIGGELYFSLPPENQWGHWGEFCHFTIPSGYHVESVTLTVYSILRNRMKWEISYSMEPDGDTDLTLSLYDKTAGSIVPGSELVWVWEEGFSRKLAEISPGNLINGHEYRLGIDSPVTYMSGPATQEYPEIMDAQLLLNIDKIEHITTWRRCLMQFIGNWDNWVVPLAWGGNYWGTSEGSICVSPRILMFFSDGSKIYFEATIFSKESWWAGQEAYACVYLEDLGIDGNSGSTGSDVDGSLLEWPEDITDKLSRKRTDILTLINDNEYGNRQPDSDVEYVYFPNGFIVTKII